MEEKKLGRWVYDSSNLTLVIYNERDRGIMGGVGTILYEVDLERCRTSKQILDWVAHISKKNWANGEVIKDLIDTMDKIFDLRTINLLPEGDKLRELINKRI